MLWKTHKHTRTSQHRVFTIYSMYCAKQNKSNHDLAKAKSNELLTPHLDEILALFMINIFQLVDIHGIPSASSNAQRIQRDISAEL